jgi:hypothetical protein
MPKALFGFVGEPPSDPMLRRLRALETRVAELERDLAVIEEELALRKRFETDNAQLRRLLTEAERERDALRSSA